MEKDCSNSGDIPRQLVSKIQIINPDLTVCRENCFYVLFWVTNVANNFVWALELLVLLDLNFYCT